MRFPTMGDTLHHPILGVIKITSWREHRGRREYFSGLFRLGYLEDVLPWVVDFVLRSTPVKTSIKTSIELPIKLSRELDEAVAKTNMSKAQYIRTGIELINILVVQPDSRILLRMNNKTSRIVIPGISKGVVT